MISTIQLPNSDQMAELLESLYGLEVTPVPQADADIRVIAEYTDSDGTPVAWLGCDLVGACRMGSALTQIPPSRVEESVSEQVLADTMQENLFEVCNICVNLFVSSAGSRISFSRLLTESDSEFADARTSVDAGEIIGLDVARYGACTLRVAGT